VVVLGERGIGKTNVLRQLANQLPAGDHGAFLDRSSRSTTASFSVLLLFRRAPGALRCSIQMQAATKVYNLERPPEEKILL